MRFFKSSLLAAALLGAATFALSHAGADEPVQGGTLIYLDRLAHSNLYPPLSQWRRIGADHRPPDLAKYRHAGN